VGLAFPIVVALAFGSDYGETGDRYRLAPAGASSGIGHGKFVTGGMDGLSWPKKLAISFER
jgi:hypothetical protein